MSMNVVATLDVSMRMRDACYNDGVRSDGECIFRARGGLPLPNPSPCAGQGLRLTLLPLSRARERGLGGEGLRYDVSTTDYQLSFARATTRFSRSIPSASTASGWRNVTRT